MLTPRARTVAAVLRAMGLAAERHFTNDHRVLNRATWSARQGSQLLLGPLITRLVPSEATIVLGADDPGERRSGRKIAGTGCYRDAVHSSKTHVIHCFGLKWVAMMLWVSVPWSRRVWALPLLTARCWPAASGQTRAQIHEREAPTELARLGRARGYSMGNHRGGLVRREAETALGFLAHGAVVYPRWPPVALRYVLVCDPEGKLRDSGGS
jgi:hypothetical protein